ncbi:MaoC family dehydratase [Rhodoferax sp. OV413]|uniref:MaoC family dehydratase n=1 Tax=Rhodoferax sp. OV413 TaxID=1855285 RepID=UPI0025FFA207|nr:MaoC family dehydratase [Rhodoferax sp. OV413]
MKTFDTLAELSAQVGTTIAVSDWLLVTQEQIRLFAQATGDQQWIHVDPERAAKGPFGTTVAHGFLTLSLIPQFLESSLAMGDVQMSVNCGLNKVRFVAPVPVMSRLRAHFKLLATELLERGGVQQIWEVTVEIEGHKKPACVAELVLRQYV